MRIITSTSSSASQRVIAAGNALRTSRFSALRLLGPVERDDRDPIGDVDENDVVPSCGHPRKSNATLIAPVWSCVASVMNASRQSSRRNVCVSMPVRSTWPLETRSR